ncbi:DMT family transporter [Pseudoxanthomonas dokdonensis]|uniref:Membrane protein n=1 Tax=Pseudoxanthomonas dokdonensis TaxID=344882 RepID=A0A0R0CQK1_9GAMM|nr:DMT family transporter [Pseudoxanthomonas dokdonensis]KRG71739.1 membrane protein [Pseudoxanthomonas dokdonensis]
MTRLPTPASPMLLMLLAVLLFALMDAGLKLLAPHYPVMQVAALRGLSSLPFIVIWALASVPLASLWRVRWRLHLLRGALGVAMMAGFVYGLRELPLSTAYAITFVAPLLVTAMAGPLLHERVGPARWWAIGLGLCGVLVILRPSGQGMATLGGLAILLAAVCYACGAISVRVLARHDSNQAMVLWFMVLLSLGASALAYADWQPLRGSDIWIIGLVGVAGSLAQVALTEAFRRGEASLIAPLEYSALLWGVLLDVLLWQVLPDALTWVGAGIIVASGFYLLRRERVHVEAEHP